jgi:serine/threonine protein kinase
MTRGDFCDASYMVLQNEQQVLSCTARSDHVIHCHAYGVIKYGLLPWQQLPCLLLERAAGSVQQKLEEHQAAAAPGHHIRPAGLPEGEVWRIMKIVMPGMIAVAEADIVWKDVKPSNIVYAARSRGRALPVLCDFGSSKLVGPDGLEIAAAPGGTSAFVSPEFKYGRRVGRACDVWGFGCLLLALRLGREVQLLPDVEPDGAAASWDAAAVLREFEGELTSREMSFVAQCLTYEASARPAILALGRHEYFRPAGLANHWQAVGAMMLLE